MISRPTASPTVVCCLRIFNKQTSPERAWKITTPFVGSFRKIAKSDYTLCHVRPLRNLGSHWTDFSGISFLRIFENMSRKFEVRSDRWRMTGTLHEDIRTLMIISLWIFLEWDTLQTKVIEKIKTHIFCWIIFFFSQIVPFMRQYENYGKAGKDKHDNIIQRMRIACWISRATGTHSEYVIPIAFVR